MSSPLKSKNRTTGERGNDNDDEMKLKAVFYLVDSLQSPRILTYPNVTQISFLCVSTARNIRRKAEERM